MPINNVPQPELIRINDSLRLRKYDGNHDFALSWYQEPETVFLVDGTKNAYTPERLKRMYDYLDGKGELYFIEALINGAFRPIGDVTFWQEDMPIVIGEPDFRGKGIGRNVIAALIQRAKALGYPWIQVDCIYDYNVASQKCFTKMGFYPIEKTESGHRYRLDLT